MYNIEDFEPYRLRKSLNTEPVLVWSKRGGYQFFSFIQQMTAIGEGLDFKIVGIKERK